MYGYYQQPPYQPYQAYNPTPMQRQELVRVNGMEGAKAYRMPANSVVALFDANEDTMYIKTTDGAGFPSIRTFSFSERIRGDVPTPAEDNLITRQAYDQIIQTLDEIKGMIGNGKQSVQRKQPDTKPGE